MSVPLKEKMTEFYTWMYTKDIGPNQDDALQAARKDLEKALELLSKATDEFNDVSKGNLASRVSKLSLSELVLIIELFRYLTNTSRINFKISFIVWLCQRKVANLSISRTVRGQTRYALAIKIRGKVRPLPSYETLLKIIHNSESITREVINFFAQRELITSIKRISELGKRVGLPVFLDLASLYQKRGVMAAIRGRSAEEIVRNKLLSWGAIPEIHFNLSDVSLKGVIENKLNRIADRENADISKYEKEVRRIQSSRRLDLTIPVADPIILVQSVFYTSDTGGIAHSTVDQNLLTRRLIEVCIPQRECRVEFIGLVDGPGWAYLVTDLRKTIIGFDDFFQIRSLDSKFRRKLRKLKILLPIDAEEAIFTLSQGATHAELDLVIQKLSQFFSLPENEVSEQLVLFSRHGKVTIEDDKISFDPLRLALIKESWVLGEVLDSNLTEESGEKTLSINTPLGARTIELERISNKLAGTIALEELNAILKKLEVNGSISFKKGKWLSPHQSQISYFVHNQE